MRRALAALALGAAALCAVFGARAQEPAAGAADVPANHAFRAGERFEYQVKLGMFRVGHASMEVRDIDTVRGDSVYHVLFIIQGRAIVYALSDTLQSWFGVRDLVSRRFQQDQLEGGHERHRRYEVFPDRGIWIRNETDTAATVAQPLDDASFFYFARTIPLEIGESYDFHRYFLADRNPVTIRVLGRDSVSVPAGRFAAIAVRPIFKARGLFGQSGQATIWFSDDEARIPVRIRSRMSIGTLDLSLRSRN